MNRQLFDFLLILILILIQMIIIFKVKEIEKKIFAIISLFVIILLSLSKWPFNLGGWLILTLISIFFGGFIIYEGIRQKSISKHRFLSYLIVALYLIVTAVIFAFIQFGILSAQNLKLECLNNFGLNSEKILIISGLTSKLSQSISKQHGHISYH